MLAVHKDKVITENDIECKELYVNSLCDEKYSQQKGDELVNPKVSVLFPPPAEELSLPCPHPEMPDDVKEIYLEAKSVFLQSSMAARTLLQLATELLLLELGYDETNIHEMIVCCEKQDMPEELKTGFDSLRFYRHKGTIHIEKIHFNQIENKEKVRAFFDLLNIIVEKKSVFLKHN